MKQGGKLSIASALEAHYNKLNQKDDRPNVLIIMTDQQRYDTIASLGFDYMYTPNLDRLVSEGTAYTNAYTPNPICLPARHSLFTGRSCGDHGMADNDFNARLDPAMPVFPRILSQGGYITEAIGKMHFQPCREHHGFQRLKLMEEVPEIRYDDDYLTYLNDSGYGNVQNIHGVRNLLFFLPQQALVPKEHHGTTWVTDRGLEFLDQNAGKRPFMLYLSYIAPHPPFNSYSEYSDLYSDKDLPTSAVEVTPLQVMCEENKMFGDVPDDATERRVKEVYFGMISQVDEQIGRVLQKLEEKNQLDNTMIIFTSDHGEMLGDFSMYQKFQPYDVSTRIPMIIRYPKAFEKGKKEERFADLTDIFPTVLQAAGFDPKECEGLVGESLMAQNPVKDRDHQYVAYSEGNRRWASVRDERYKFTYYYGGGIKTLFDLKEDPQETVDLLYSDITDHHLAVAKRLYRKVVAYEKQQWKTEYIKGDELIVLEPYEAVCTRNKAFPQFLRHLNQEEKLGMNDFIDEVIDATADEPVVDFYKLDHEAFRVNSGFDDGQMNRLMKRIHTRR